MFRRDMHTLRHDLWLYSTHPILNICSTWTLWMSKKKSFFDSWNMGLRFPIWDWVAGAMTKCIVPAWLYCVAHVSAMVLLLLLLWPSLTINSRCLHLAGLKSGRRRWSTWKGILHGPMLTSKYTEWLNNYLLMWLFPQSILCIKFW